MGWRPRHQSEVDNGMPVAVPPVHFSEVEQGLPNARPKL